MIDLTESRRLIREYLLSKSVITADVFWMEKLNEEFERGKTETTKLFLDAVIAGGYDLSPCMACGTVVVCIPDGLPMCEACAMKETSDG